MFKKENFNLLQTYRGLFKYQVYMSAWFRNHHTLNAVLFEWFQSQHYEPSNCPPFSTLYGSSALTHLEETLELLNYHIYLKSKEETCMAEEPSHVKQLSINQVCKIGLKGLGKTDS